MKTYRVEILGIDGSWHLHSEHSARRLADQKHRDLCSAGYERIRVVSPSGRIVNESEVVAVKPEF